MAVDWTQLPGDILQSISKKITVSGDYVKFRAVCPEWRSSLPKFPRHLLRQFPWLMIPFSQSQSHCSFYDLSTDVTHVLELPEAARPDLRICSSNGWLVIFDDSPTILLLDPLTGAKLHLPPLSSFPNVVSFDRSKVGKEYAILGDSGDIYRLSLRQMRDLFIKKIVLSSGPANNDNMVNALAILGKSNDLACYKNGDQSWTFLDNFCLSWCDGIYYKEQFYVVSRDGTIAVCDVNCEMPIASLIYAFHLFSVISKMHLVISGDDELLLILRNFSIDGKRPDNKLYLKTTGFDVYRMNWGRQPYWDRVVNLGRRLLFIGEYSSVSLSAYDVRGCVRNPSFSSPYYGQCLGNCIYFTDDRFVYYGDGTVYVLDRGIYQLRNEKIIAFPGRARDPHSIWFIPSTKDENLIADKKI
ncbi:F-box protein SKIP23-like [Corylus avellana]|uniref:F-box protein SKIP23-like n=1 Tax=Corylus avellana TaxID=13451 RepID=UPI002869FEE8|nr:F-box protein SKIP23-like [Corylus avellana]